MPILSARQRPPVIQSARALASALVASVHLSLLSLVSMRAHALTPLFPTWLGPLALRLQSGGRHLQMAWHEVQARAELDGVQKA